jgi:hypothetical protein
MVLFLVTFFGSFELAQEKSETEKKERQECIKVSNSFCGKHEM